MTNAVPVPASATKAEIIAGFEECWASMTALCRTLTEHEWTTESICPGWQTKHVLLHRTAGEIGFSRWDRSGPLSDELGGYYESLRESTGAEILAEFERIIAVRRTQLAGMDETDFDAQCWTPAGPSTYRRYMEITLFDHWAHEQDIRVPLAKPGNLSGLGAEFSLNEAHIALGYLIGKRANAPQGARVTIHVTSPTTRDLHVVVDGRAQVVAKLNDPTVELTTDFATFMLLCCGRIDPAGPLDDERVTLSGDTALGEAVATNLAFTI